MNIETISLIRMSALFFCAFFNLFFTFIIWKRGRQDRSVFRLGFVALFSFLYALAYGMIFFPGSDKLFWTKATWVGTFIIPAYFGFILSVVGKDKKFAGVLYGCYFLAVAISVLSLTTSLVILNTNNYYPYDNEYGPAALLGRFYISMGLLVSVFYLIGNYFKIDDASKNKLKYLILGISIYTFGGVFAAGVIPLFFPGFNFIDISAYASIPFISLTAYAIVKKKLFDIKVILTETLVYGFFIFLLVQTIFNNFFRPLLVQTIDLALFAPIAYLLIKASRREVQRSEILEQKVAERTKELEEAKKIAESSQKIAEERAAELEKWYKLTVGREMRMAELKDKIKEMEQK